MTRRFLIGPAANEEATPTTAEAGLETSAAIAERIDQGRLKLPKRDVAEYLVKDRCENNLFVDVHPSIVSSSIIFVHNQAVVNMHYHVF